MLVRTSNPGAAELQDAGDPPLYERLAGLVAELGAGRLGECGLSLVGAVTGATRPEHLERLRELMPHAVFLLPGVGRPGRPRRGPGARLRAAPGGGPRDGLPVDRERARAAGRRPAHAAAEAAEELRAAAWEL